MMYVWSLTLEDCFHIHLLKRESFSVLALNLSLTRGLICNYKSVMWKLEASSAHTQRINFSVCPVVKLLKPMNVCIFRDSEFFNEGERACVILRLFNKVI